jgi:hypothetical protein
MYKHSRKILDVALFSLKTIIIKCVFTGESILLKPHPEDPKWMEVYMPLPSCEKDKTFFYGSIQHHQDCYLLPAAPSVYEAMAMQFEPHKVLLRNQLPKVI